MQNYLVTAEQKRFFIESGFIEFEQLLSKDLCQMLHDSLCEQMNKKGASPAEKNGRDLSRTLPAARALLCNPKLHAPALQLLEQPLLRLGFDHFFLHSKNFSVEKQNPLKIKEMSSFQNPVGALLIRLSAPTLCDADALSTKPLTRSPFVSGSPGSALILSPHLALPFSLLLQQKESSFLLIGYLGKDTIYLRNPNDPYNHALKSLGYCFGDAMTTETHPILIHKVASSFNR